MPRLREFKFTGGEEPKTVEAMSYKKAVKSIQNKIKDTKVIIEYISKRGKQIKEYAFLPIGRKKKLGR